MHKMRTKKTIMTIILTLTLSTVFAQIDCKKCDIEKVKVVSENMDNLNIHIVEEFLCTFDNSCNTNIEYSQWSNEILYQLFDNDPELIFKVFEQGQVDNAQILLNELEHPIQDFDYQKIYNEIEETKTNSDFKDKVLKSIELAAYKKGLKIKD